MSEATETLLARSTLTGYLGVRSREPVTIEAWSPALPWARAFVVEARRLGAEPVLAVEDEEGFFRSLARSGPVPTAPASLARLGGAYAYFPGPEAFPRLLGLGPDDLRLALERHGPAWRASARRSGVRGASLTVATVTTTAAARFGVNVDAWREEVVEASLVPPRVLSTAAVRLGRRLLHARTLSIRHTNGTSLRVGLRAGRWSEESGAPSRSPGSSGRLWTAIPTGRLKLPLLPGSAQGRWEANRPVHDRLGESALGVGARFEFRDGRLREVAFDRGGETFAAAFERARHRGFGAAEITIGLNPRVARAPEIGDLASGVVGLRVEGSLVPGGRGGHPLGHLSLLHGAEVDLDDRAWLVGGRAVGGRHGRP